MWECAFQNKLQYLSEVLSTSHEKSFEHTPADSWFYTLTILDHDSDQQSEIKHSLSHWSLLVIWPIKKKIYCTQTHFKFYFSLLKKKSGSLFWDVYKGNITGLHTLVSKNFNKGYQFRIFGHFYNLVLLVRHLWITRNSNSEHSLLIFQSSSNQLVLIFN